MLCSPTQIAACHRHLYLAQARPHDAVSICLVLFIGASLSEPHTYVKYATAVCMCIYIYVPYVVLGHGANLCRVQNRQNGRPLRSHCVRLKYSLRTALNEKEIVRNEAYTPTFPPGKDTGIGRRNIANSSSSTLENSQDPKRSTLQITPIIQCPQATKNTQQHNRF